MSTNRSAVDTIKGYFYQFDYSILKILEQSDESVPVQIEGIEDLDICNASETTAIQCKYYSKTEYNHSIISKPIRLMLTHYSQNVSTFNFKYYLYGHFQSGQNKLPVPITLSFIKDKIFTYKKGGIIHYHHQEIGVTDNDIINFLSHLQIEINAPNYEEQEIKIKEILKTTFNCTKLEAEYYYKNSLCVIKALATNYEASHRTITKKEFVEKITSEKFELFELWLLNKIGTEKYCKIIKKDYFTVTNISPHERFFLIECDSTITEVEMKTLLIKISKRWSKLSKRDPTPFCPFIYI
jgi:hypothetical protein